MPSPVHPDPHHDDVLQALRLLESAVARQQLRVKEAMAARSPTAHVQAERESLERLQHELGRLRALLAGDTH